MDVREQITALREQLRYHNEKYYNEDAPEITDYEYDMLQRQTACSSAVRHAVTVRWART